MARPNSSLLKTLRLWTSLRRTARELAAAERDLASPLGLSLVQGQALMVLADSGPLTMHDFADCLCIAPSTATRLADQIEEKGWATRTVDPTDRRRNMLELAEPGLQLVDELTDLGLARARTLSRQLHDPSAVSACLDDLVDAVHNIRTNSGS